MVIKILLVEPNVKYPVRQDHVGFNLGLLSVASYALSQLNEEISISYLSLRLNKAIGEDTDFNLELRRFKPDIVGVSSITCDFPDSIDVIRSAKEYGAKTILGGIFPTLNYEWIKEKYPAEIDAIVRGEGEISFSEILKTEIEHRNLCPAGSRYTNYTNELGVPIFSDKRNPMELKDLPKLAYHLLPIEKYRQLGIPASTFTSRGCINDCLFCSVKDMWKGVCRFRPLNDVAEEIEILSTKYRFKKVKIIDNTISVERIKLLLDLIEQRGINPLFRINIRLDQIDEKSLQCMYDGGVDEILFGVESASKELLQTMGKVLFYSPGLWNNKALEIAKEASKVGYTIHPTFILGWPGETDQTLERTKRLAIKLGKIKNVIPYLSFATPYPGTRFHASSLDLGIKILTHDFCRYTNLFPVAVPISLGVDGLKKLVQTYNSISKETNTTEWNPEIDIEYLNNLNLKETV